MKGQRTHEYVIPFPAQDVWEVVGSIELPNLVKHLPGVLDDLVVDGDGLEGSIFTLVVPKGWPFRVYKEKVVKVDNVNRVKDVDVISGGVLDHGFTFGRTRFEIVELGPTTSLFRGIIFYEINDDQAAEKIPMVQYMEMDTTAEEVAKYLVKKKSYARKLSGEQSFEMDVPHSAAAVWKVYSTLKLAQLIKELKPGSNYHGDGSVGTLLSVVVPPDGPIGSYKERIVTVDHQKRMKETDVIEGGVLERDFTFFRIRFEIFEKGPNSATIKSTITFELNPTSPTASVNMSKLVNVMEMKVHGDVASKYLSSLNKPC
ncbi:S-norcoclaurine synthase 2-like [Aristolochia californica]|uniref:S-norcoclaurine synthase 2-like n=1 Tax=Aristolochia californica TaxID=171875 RepID=UPI0035D635BD